MLLLLEYFGDNLGREHVLPVLSVFGTIGFIVAIGYLLAYLVRIEEEDIQKKQSTKNNNNNGNTEIVTNKKKNQRKEKRTMINSMKKSFFKMERSSKFISSIHFFSSFARFLIYPLFFSKIFSM